ncbi:hypothetical protein SO802_012627 [Lithocarpus litseifolius]|uniref:RNase H type-1 domain-containing protein n=1 Tax=Lithocarpus litseifolius TaxID=425828 RepID=A0AAW2D409_9ROSI
MDLILRLGQEGRNVELFTVMAWFIWCRRNKCHFNEPSIPVDKLLEAALKSLSEFQSKQPTGTTHQKPAAPKWQPPPKDTYKINYDGAVFSKSEEAGIGVVIRNERGEMMASLAEKVESGCCCCQMGGWVESGCGFFFFRSRFLVVVVVVVGGAESVVVAGLNFTFFPFTLFFFFLFLSGDFGHNHFCWFVGVVGGVGVGVGVGVVAVDVVVDRC